MAGGVEGAEGKEETKTLRKMLFLPVCACVSVTVHVSVCAWI